MMFLASTASALPIHVFGSQFGAEGSGPGQFAGPAGVAVNEVTLGSTGDVYVVDEGNNRVEIFTAEGQALKGEFNGESTPAGSFSSPNMIAIDNSTDPLDPSAGDVYVVDSGHKVIDKFDPTGHYLSQITTGAEGGPFIELLGVAVGPQGTVEVYTIRGSGNGQVDSYSDAATNVFERQVTLPFGAAPGLAVDPEGRLYVNRGVLRFAQLSSGIEPVPLVPAINPEEDATAAAFDDSSGTLYIDETSSIGGYDPTSPTERFGAQNLTESRGVAIDSTSEVVYATDHATGTVSVFTTVLTPTVLTGEGTDLQQTTATLNGTVNPEGLEVGSCEFEYGTTSEYGNTIECEQHPGSGETAVPVSANITGLELGTYHFRLDATNTNGQAHGADHTFLITAAPTVSAETLLSTGATSATVSARINPEGAPTSYHLEYGTTTAYGTSSPETSMGAGFAAAKVSIILNGLTPGATYHARVTATNTQGSTRGLTDITITTLNAGGVAGTSACLNQTYSGFSPSLPDCRAYEFVSANGGRGTVYYPASPDIDPVSTEDIPTSEAMRADAAGGAVAYVAESAESGGNGASGRGLGNQFLATRNAEEHQWDVSNITPLLSEINETPQAPAYEAYAPDLSNGVFASVAASIASEATPHGPTPCQVLYMRTTDAQFHALFSETLTPGECGQSTSFTNFTSQNLLFAGQNVGSPTVAAGSHLLFQSPAPLVAGAASSPSGEDNGTNLYESTGGIVRLVSVLPNGEADPDASFGAPADHSSRPNFSNVISQDGSRVFWTDLTDGRLYDREDGTVTKPVSIGRATYRGASNDGRLVFYTESGTLWRFDTDTNSRESLTAMASGTGDLGAATGEATLALGSKVVTSLATTTGAFAEGQQIAGIGLPANTTIAKLEPSGPGTLELSAPVTEAGEGVALHAGSVEVSHFTPNAGALTSGMEISGPGIAPGTFVVSVGAQSLVLSQPATEQLGGAPLTADAGVLGVAGISGDGDYVYFAAQGGLVAGATHRVCKRAIDEETEKANAGTLTLEEAERFERERHEEEKGRMPPGRGCNLYFLHAGATNLIATLSARDNTLPSTIEGVVGSAVGAWQGQLGKRTAQVADNGRELVFESTLQLTGYDNSSLDAANGIDHGLEVFVYEAESNRVRCASCNPGGTPPAPESLGQGGGTYLPVSMNGTEIRRWVSADGSRVFFDSSQPLSAQDSNGVQDVYEWERAGSGSCPADSAAGGCVSLLSGGDSADQSFFVDASADGGDVFLTHRGLLTGQGAADGHVALFDARAGGGFPESSTACTGTGCQGVPPASPGYATPPSATFAGTGNYPPAAKPVVKPTRAQLLAKALKSCRRKRARHRRIACEKQARKKYGSATGTRRNGGKSAKGVTKSTKGTAR